MSTPLHFIASPKPQAQMIVTELVERYGQADLSCATCVVAVGGDGTTLKALEAVLGAPHIPVFSMRTPGSVGALGNTLALEGLIGRLPRCRRITIKPLQFEAERVDGSIATGISVNEVTVMRRRFQATRLRVQVGSQSLELFGDGVLVASPVGSTGYCRSLGGPRIALDTDLIALTGIAVRRPSDGFRIAAPGSTTVSIEVADPIFRPSRLETQSSIVPDVRNVTVRSCPMQSATLLLELGDAIQMGTWPALALAGASDDSARDAD
jgi:NAD+ kinase